MRSKRSFQLGMILTYATVAATLFVFLFPIFWMILTSFKFRTQAFTSVPLWIFQPTLENYRSVLIERGFLRYVGNSMFVGALSTVVTLVLGASISYPLSRYRIIGGKQIAFWILSLRIIPPIVVILPIYLIISNLQLTDTYVALIMMYTFMNLPIAVWLMRGFIIEIPVDLEESAMVDGCSRFASFLRIVVPLAAPGFLATGILCFIFAWNEFLFANILVGAIVKTAPVGLTEYVTPVSVLWTEIMAAGTVVILPVWVITMLIQRYLVRGLTMGAVKG